MFKIVDVPEDCGCSRLWMIGRLWMYVEFVDIREDCGGFVKIVDVREDCGRS